MMLFDQYLMRYTTLRDDHVHPFFNNTRTVSADAYTSTQQGGLKHYRAYRVREYNNVCMRDAHFEVEINCKQLLTHENELVQPFDYEAPPRVLI